MFLVFANIFIFEVHFHIKRAIWSLIEAAHVPLSKEKGKHFFVSMAGGSHKIYAFVSDL